MFITDDPRTNYRNVTGLDIDSTQKHTIPQTFVKRSIYVSEIALLAPGTDKLIHLVGEQGVVN